jgi:hypothetical protein
MVLISSVKVLSFLRVFKQFDKLVKLLQNVMSDILPFVCLFFLWFSVVALLFDVAGVKLSDGD